MIKQRVLLTCERAWRAFETPENLNNLAKAKNGLEVDVDFIIRMANLILGTIAVRQQIRNEKNED
jgi:hypothetical protein